MISPAYVAQTGGGTTTHRDHRESIIRAWLVRSAVTASLFLSLLGNVEAAQTPTEELARLREVLELPDSATISLAAAPNLPTVSPIKLFIATGLDLGVRQNFLKWVADWNREDGNEHGPVVLVNSAVSADVILARLVDREKARTGTGTDLLTGTVYDPQTRTARTVPYAAGYSYTVVPVFAYVLSQSSQNSFDIVWRYAATTGSEETKDSGKQLWKDFKKLMKNRPDQRR
jgi:hypothetical protein